MQSIHDGEIRGAFAESNILSFDYDKYLTVVEAVLGDYEMEPSDVLGVSEALGLVVVCRTGVVRGDQRGIFNKRVEVGDLIRFDSVAELVREQRQPRGRESWIKLIGEGGRSLAEFVWHAGGPVEIADAARERDRVYEIMLSAARAPSPAPASSGPSISEYGSKRDFLLAWGHALLLAAGVPATPALVEEHALMAAGSMQLMVFLRLGARHGIDDLNQYFPEGGVPAGSPLDCFDPLYARVVEREGEAQGVDAAIEEFLDGCWADWVRGARDAHG
ncbi:MAG: hypothetical protein ACTHLH_07705 [Solirubrobacterales bacterium]